jgi:hypothetical protein
MLPANGACPLHRWRLCAPYKKGYGVLRRWQHNRSRSMCIRSIRYGAARSAYSQLCAMATSADAPAASCTRKGGRDMDHVVPVALHHCRGLRRHQQNHGCTRAWMNLKRPAAVPGSTLWQSASLGPPPNLQPLHLAHLLPLAGGSLRQQQPNLGLLSPLHHPPSLGLLLLPLLPPPLLPALLLPPVALAGSTWHLAPCPGPFLAPVQPLLPLAASSGSSRHLVHSLGPQVNLQPGSVDCH